MNAALKSHLNFTSAQGCALSHLMVAEAPVLAEFKTQVNVRLV